MNTIEVTGRPCVQGHIMKNQLYPTTTENDLGFRADARCLIDYGTAFLCLVEATTILNGVSVPVPVHRQGLYRLEIRKHEFNRARDIANYGGVLDNDQCQDLIRQYFHRLPYMEIQGIQCFPFFGRDEIVFAGSKRRAAICFWGDNGNPVYLALFAPTEDKMAEHIGMDVNLDWFTNSPKESHIDFSKIATIPETYTLDDADINGHDTFHQIWNLDRAVNVKPEVYGDLREKIINKLCEICCANPHFQYVDYTLAQDLGTPFQGRWVDAEGDMCLFRGVYQGPDVPLKCRPSIE